MKTPSGIGRYRTATARKRTSPLGCCVFRERRYLGGMVRPIPIDLCEVSPFLRQIVKCEDCRRGTNRDACSAINATVRLNIELMRSREFDLLTAGVNHIARAGIYTRSVLDTNA